MAILWQSSLVPFIDPSGDPYSGAKAYFFNSGTTTPRTVYEDSALGISHDHPVVANASGMFPAVFLPSGDFRLRITDADDATMIDVDGISAPIGGTVDAPDAGDTAVELLARTGDLKFRYDTGTHSGWVRCNGRTIGAAASGASERANGDTEALFLHLWGADATLTVSGGRGGTAAGDFAAAKTIALPDFRARVLAGMSGMGATALTTIPDSLVDSSETANTLGATAGAAEHTLTEAQMPAHDHGAATGAGGSHAHSYDKPFSAVVSGGSGATIAAFAFGAATSSTVGAHAHTVASDGGGGAHPNVQPTAFATVYIKL